jgi:hypothetical protein
MLLGSSSECVTGFLAIRCGSSKVKTSCKMQPQCTNHHIQGLNFNTEIDCGLIGINELLQLDPAINKSILDCGLLKEKNAYKLMMLQSLVASESET